MIAEMAGGCLVHFLPVRLQVLRELVRGRGASTLAQHHSRLPQGKRILHLPDKAPLAGAVQKGLCGEVDLSLMRARFRLKPVT